MSSFTIDQEKLESVISIYNNEVDPSATDEVIEETILADWNEGDEHQEWIDASSAQEISDWLASFTETAAEKAQDDLFSDEVDNLIAAHSHLVNPEQF